jgi:hypothetical protein
LNNNTKKGDKKKAKGKDHFVSLQAHKEVSKGISK